MKLFRALLVLILPISAVFADYKSDIASFLKKHCLRCHGAEKQKGRIRYDNIQKFDPENHHLWTLVHEQLSGGEMPPEEETPPTAAEIQKVLAWIEKEQRAARTGKTRRLNRRELSAALQDLTGLEVDYAYMLPEDGKVNGFDTGAEGLHDAADSVSRIMEVVRRAVDGIRFLEPDSAKTYQANLADSKDPRKELDNWKHESAYVKTRGYKLEGKGLLIEPKWLGDRGGQEFYFPVDPKNKKGVVRMTASVSVHKGKFPEMPDVMLWTRVAGRNLGYYPIGNQTDSPRTIQFDAQIDDAPLDSKRGLKVTLVNRVEFPYGVKGFANDEKAKPEDKIPGGSSGLYRPWWDKKKKKLKPEETPYPYLVLHDVKFVIGQRNVWPPESWGVDLGEIKDNDDSAEKLLNLWMQKAWRRPVSKAEQKRYLDFYKSLRKKEMSFDNALRATFQSALMSGPFRYMTSPSQSDHPQHALATRLSFLLNGSPPDTELRKLADAGKLKDAKVLDLQIERLLKNDKAHSHFWTPFVLQWLEMEQPITLVMDHIKKQDFKFGRNLKESMRQETIQYIQTLFDENRPASELIQSDWTMMNNILARHYDYKGIEGSHMRKVPLRKDDPRSGGVLSHAGIQSMLCWMGENWVIYRGAWALRHILDKPPPPPPLEVPELDPSSGKNKGKTFRELLVQHQNDEKCSVCHKYMDPLGFAFQNFDISGRWRDKEYESYKRDELDGKIAWRGAGKSRPVDASGRLPRGEPFKNYEEWKKIVTQSYMEDIAGGLLKNLVLYGTGRTPDVDDIATIRTILQENQSMRLKDCLKKLLNSETFTKH